MLAIQENLDTESRQEKLQTLDRNLDGAFVDENGAKSKTVSRILPIMSSKKAFKDMF